MLALVAHRLERGSVDLRGQTLPIAKVDKLAQRRRQLIHTIARVEDEQYHGLLEVALELGGSGPRQLFVAALAQLLAEWGDICLRKFDRLLHFLSLDNFNQLLFEQFKIQLWIAVQYLIVSLENVTYDWADVVQQNNSLFNVAAQDEFAHLRPLLDQFFAEVYSHVLIHGVVKVDVCLLDESLRAVSVALDYQEVDDQLIEQGSRHLDLVQSLPPKLERIR